VTGFAEIKRGIADEEKRERRRSVAVALVAVAFVLAAVGVAVMGCSSTQEQRQSQVIAEAVALLNHPAPGDPAWESRRATFQADAKPFLPPKPAPSPNSTDGH